MYKFYYKYITVIVLALYLQGCGIASVSVYGIGLSVMRGNEEIPMIDNEIFLPNNTIDINIYEWKYRSKIGYMMIAEWEEYDKELIGNIPLQVDGIPWYTKQCDRGGGQVEHNMNGIKYLLQGTLVKTNRGTCKISLENFERKPYGYFAQSLALLSVPIDVGIIATFIAGSYVVAPFLALYSYITSDQSENVKDFSRK